MAFFDPAKLAIQNALIRVGNFIVPEKKPVPPPVAPVIAPKPTLPIFPASVNAAISKGPSSQFVAPQVPIAPKTLTSTAAIPPVTKQVFPVATTPTLPGPRVTTPSAAQQEIAKQVERGKAEEAAVLPQQKLGALGSSIVGQTIGGPVRAALQTSILPAAEQLGVKKASQPIVPGSDVSKFFLGEEPIYSVPEIARQSQAKIAKGDVAGGIAGAGLAGLGILADVTPGGGSAKKKAAQEALDLAAGTAPKVEKAVVEAAPGLIQKAKNIANDVKGFFSRPAPEEVFTQLEKKAAGATPPPAPIVEGIVPGARKKRGFIETVTESPQVPKTTKERVAALPDDKLYYDVHTDKEALAKARANIAASSDQALAKVMSSDSLDKDTVTTGIELMRVARAAKNYELEAQIAGRLAEEGTKQGQMIQALSILNKLSPEGVLMYATKRAGTKLGPQLTEKLGKMARDIELMPYGFQKMKALQELAQTIAREVPRTPGEKAFDMFLEIANVPRAIMSSVDLSFGLRQGLVAGWKHPKEWLGAFGSQFKALRSEQGYDEIMDQVVKNPDFMRAADAGVAFSDVNAKLALREEQYASSLAEKIPVFGHVIKGSNRAYSAMGNKLRMDAFSSLMNAFEKQGLNPRQNERLMKETASLVNDMTGRGDLPQTLKRAAPLLNAIFFSPRLMASRLNLLAPAKYMVASPAIRKEYLKTMLAFGAGTGTILGLASLIPGVKIGTDPRSADFGKIKRGNTRVDILGGFQQYMRIAAQVLTGKYVNSTTGRVITLGEGYQPLTRKDVLLRGIESKEAPIMSFLTRMLEGQDLQGEKISPSKEALDRFKPMFLNDLWDLYKEDPSLLPLGFLSSMGVGVQTYGPPEAYVKNNEINKSANPAAEFEKLKKENPALAEKVKRVKIEENFNEFDWGLTYMGVENGDRAKFLLEHFKRLPTEAAKSALYEDLRKKRLISEKVADQIQFLREAEQK